MDVPKSIVFLYSNNNISKKEIKETISLTMTSKAAHLGIRLNKEVKGLYTGNYKTPMKEIEEGTNK